MILIDSRFKHCIFKCKRRFVHHDVTYIFGTLIVGDIRTNGYFGIYDNGVMQIKRGEYLSLEKRTI